MLTYEICIIFADTNNLFYGLMVKEMLQHQNNNTIIHVKMKGGQMERLQFVSVSEYKSRGFKGIPLYKLVVISKI